MRRTMAASAAALLIVLSLAIPVSAGQPVSDGASAPVRTVDTGYALVQLKGEPLSTYAKTKPGPGKKIDMNSVTTKSYRAQLSAQRNDFKKWLQVNAPRAQITGAWDISLNAVGVKLNGTTLTKLRSAPQVKRAELQGVYHKTAEDIDLSLVHAMAAWAEVGGHANAGKGVKVGIVDTGIDQDHPCFNDAGYTAPAGFPKGQLKYTNAKVIVAKVFNNKGRQNGFDAEAIDDHGTHVAGTVACDWETGPASVGTAALPYDPSGVAPAAFLGNYNVFPGDVEDARSEDILNALDAAYADGMDVVNMSLGGGANGVQDLLTTAVDDLDIANMVVAVAAGNEGDGDPEAHPPLPAGHYTVGSPGSAARALTAGASTVGQAVRSLVRQGSASYSADSGDFASPTSDLTKASALATGGAPVALVPGILDGCAPFPATPSVAGKTVLIARGVCDFAVKVNNAQKAGAAAVIIVNRDPEPIPMADTPALGNTIVAVMVGKSAGLALAANVPANVTITAPVYVSEQDPATAAFAPVPNVQATFSSQGPTDVDFRVKPDLMAPGENVISSVPGDCPDGCWGVKAGTSMASPHLAGAAAVVRGAHPTWTAAQVRSAIVNTAAVGAVKAVAGGAAVTDVNIVGAGLLDVSAAVKATAGIAPVSASFGAVPSGSGQVRTASVTVTNLSGASKTFALGVGSQLGAGVSFSLSQSSLTLASGASGSVVVTMTASKGASGDVQAWLTVGSGGTQVAHAALYVFLK